MPHEVLVITILDVFEDIYGTDLHKVSTEEAEKAFLGWLEKNNAHFYTKQGTVAEGVLDTIRAGKKILVYAS